MVVAVPLHFLSDSEDASSSMCWTMFGHAVWKAFSTSLGGISTVSAFDTSTTCKVYASHILHALWWWNGASYWCPTSWTVVQLRRFSLLLSAALSFHLYPLLDPFFEQQLVAFLFFITHVLLKIMWYPFVHIHSHASTNCVPVDDRLIVSLPLTIIIYKCR